MLRYAVVITQEYRDGGSLVLKGLTCLSKETIKSLFIKQLTQTDLNLFIQFMAFVSFLFVGNSFVHILGQDLWACSVVKKTFIVAILKENSYLGLIQSVLHLIAYVSSCPKLKVFSSAKQHRRTIAIKIDTHNTLEDAPKPTFY